MSEKFVENGKEYEIKSRQTAFGIEVRIFFGRRPVGPTYSITYETAADLHSTTGHSWEAELVEIAKGDLRSGRVVG